MARERDEEWFDEFWSNIDPATEDGTSAVRLIGEMFDADLIWREGDYLYGCSDARVALAASDQFLVRQIEDAAVAARKAVDAD